MVVDLSYKTRHVRNSETDSLSRLDIKRGDLIGIDNTDFEFAVPFLLGIYDHLSRGYHGNSGGIRLLYLGSERKREEFTLHTQGDMLGLWPVTTIEGGLPTNIEIVRGNCNNFTHINPYFVEHAFSGEGEIISALNNLKGYRWYADAIRQGRLFIRDRRNWHDLFERLPFGKSILGSDIRFR